MRRANRLGGAFVAAWLLSITSPAWGGPVALPIFNVVFHGTHYSAWQAHPATDDLRLFYQDDQGRILGDFTALQKYVAAQHSGLLIAANAGMFDPAGQPVGLLVQNGVEKFPLNLGDGTGNFYLKPNGVFAINAKHHAFVVESGDYPTLVPPILWATQSGPLLIHGGDINPDFRPDSKNRKLRSGVGVAKDGTVIFALSQEPVTFYDFAGLFAEKFHCPNALYLDGDISAFWTPGAVEEEGQHHFGPMIGVVEGVTAAPGHL